MVVKEFLEDREMYNPNIESAVQEYSRLKCQELLEIIAEKASKLPATIFISPGTCPTARLNKDSILNAVDLDSFIV